MLTMKYVRDIFSHEGEKVYLGNLCFHRNYFLTSDANIIHSLMVILMETLIWRHGSFNICSTLKKSPTKFKTKLKNNSYSYETYYNAVVIPLLLLRWRWVTVTYFFFQVYFFNIFGKCQYTLKFLYFFKTYIF